MVRNKESRIKFCKKIAFVFLIILSAQQIGQGSYIYAKAYLAQYLISDAWEKTLAGEQQVKPWAWADTWPVAKLTAKKFDTELYVLAGDNGRTLAFGPGYRFGTVLPGEQGTSIISGHRDTHFSFLRNIKLKDKFEIQNKNGEIIKYRVSGTEIVSVDKVFSIEKNTKSKLTLVTCYPFDSVISGGKLRYIVTLEKVDTRLVLNK